jgi:hypothetical protein
VAVKKFIIAVIVVEVTVVAYIVGLVTLVKNA